MKVRRPSLTSRFAGAAAVIAVTIVSLLDLALIYFSETFTLSETPKPWTWSGIDIAAGLTTLVTSAIAASAWRRAGRLCRASRARDVAFRFCAIVTVLNGALAATAAYHVRIVPAIHEVATRHSLPRATSISGVLIPAGATVSEVPEGTRVLLNGRTVRGGTVERPFVIGSNGSVFDVEVTRDTSFDGIACRGGSGGFAILGGAPAPDVECTSAGQRVDGIACARGFAIRHVLGRHGVACRLAAPYRAEAIMWPVGTGVDTIGDDLIDIRFSAVVRAAPPGLRLEGEPIRPTVIVYRTDGREITFR